MKLISNSQSIKVFGGATHYHWYCSLYGYRGAARKTRAASNSDATSHAKGHPSHVGYTSVVSCTGNCI